MNLMQDEGILFETQDGWLKLTTHRVRYERQYPGFAAIKSIMLEEVSSCRMQRETYVRLLVCAVLAFAAAAYLAYDPSVSIAVADYFQIARFLKSDPHYGWWYLAPLAVGCLALVRYWVTRTRELEIGSPGGWLSMNVRNWQVIDIRNFIDQLEAAKNERYLAKQSAHMTAARQDRGKPDSLSAVSAVGSSSLVE